MVTQILQPPMINFAGNTFLCSDIQLQLATHIGAAYLARTASFLNKILAGQALKRFRRYDPHPVIRGLFSAPHLPSIHVGSGGGVEPRPSPLPR